MKSIVSYPERGEGGRSSYRGNCSPKLIEDIIDQYKIKQLSDYMVGGGTTEEVCRRLEVPGTFLDLNRGFDMIAMDIPERPDNIFWHPPYDDIIKYSDVMYSAADIERKYGFDPRVNDLSRCKNYEEFVEMMNYCTLKQFTALEKGGRFFILMGDIKKKGKLYSMLCDIVKPGTLEQIIIKAQHNCWSDTRTYSGSFVPITHEYLLVLRKDQPLIIPVKCTVNRELDIRGSKNATWRDVVASVLESSSCPMSLTEIYGRIDGHKKCQTNPHWKEKVRQTLQNYNIFKSSERGVWALA